MRDVTRFIREALDQKALDNFKELRLFWHSHYANAIKGAIAGGAKVVGLDLAFGIGVDRWEPGLDNLMAEAVSTA